MICLGSSINQSLKNNTKLALILVSSSRGHCPALLVQYLKTVFSSTLSNFLKVHGETASMAVVNLLLSKAYVPS